MNIPLRKDAATEVVVVRELQLHSSASLTPRLSGSGAGHQQQRGCCWLFNCQQIAGSHGMDERDADRSRTWGTFWLSMTLGPWPALLSVQTTTMKRLIGKAAPGYP
jgi:hypothetical protein